MDSFLLTRIAVDGIAHFRYVEFAAVTRKVKTMTLTRSINVDPDIISKTPCDMHYACLSGESVCQVEPFIDRDVQLLHCREERSCAFRKQYLGRFICTCPVNRAAFSLN